MLRTLAAAALVSIALAGCATAHYTMGQDISASAVSQIVKGKTDAKELESLMGKPSQKVVITSNSEKWTYSYIDTKSSAQSYILTMKVNTETTRKTLDVLLENSVVVNYVYNEDKPVLNMQ